MRSGSAIPTSDVDPFSDAFLTDPYGDHEVLRELGPAVWLERYSLWGIARSADVESALRDPDTFCSRRGVGIADFLRQQPFRAPSLLLEADPPAHTKARRVITRVLGPKTVGDMREAFRDEAEALLEPLIRAGGFDGVTDLAEPYPLKVFTDQLGLDEGPERRHLLLYGNMVFNAFGPDNALFRRGVERAGRTTAWIMAHTLREALRAGGLGDRVHEEALAAGYSDAEAGMLVRSLLTAGVDTTVHAIGNALYCLARHPEQYAALHANPALARAAFEESIRFESPVQTFFRTATRTVDLGGVRINADDKVLLFLGAANRDPRRWERPDRFDIQRSATGHVGFGIGIHTCVGQMLARLEGESVLAVLAERVRSIRFGGDPVRQLNNALRGHERLPLVVDAA